jgi:hypothetical protein
MAKFIFAALPRAALFCPFIRLSPPDPVRHFNDTSTILLQ